MANPNRVDQVNEPDALRELLQRVRVLEATAPPAGGGSGYQFHAGAYGPDNVGDWSLLEYTDFATIPFSTPNQQGPYDPTQFSLSINAVGGVFITGSGNAVPLTVAAWDTTDTSAIQGVNFDVANTFGAGTVQGLVISSTSKGGTSYGISAGVGSASNAGEQPTGIQLTVNGGTGGVSKGADISSVAIAANSWGVLAAAETSGVALASGGEFTGSGGDNAVGVSGGANADVLAIGLHGNAGSSTGKEVGVRGQTNGFAAGANSLAIEGQTHLGVSIFQVRDDGSVHIKTGTAVIADL